MSLSITRQARGEIPGDAIQMFKSVGLNMTTAMA